MRPGNIGPSGGRPKNRDYITQYMQRAKMLLCRLLLLTAVQCPGLGPG